MFNLLHSLYTIKIVGDRRVREILEQAKDKVAKHFNIQKYLLNHRYRIGRLPELYEVGVKRIGNYIIRYARRIGKVFGVFNPYRDEIVFDYELLFKPHQLLRTAIHELVHKVQKLRGDIGRVPRYQLEKEAYTVTQRIMNKN